MGSNKKQQGIVRYLKHIAMYAAMGLLAPVICAIIFKALSPTFDVLITNPKVLAVMVGFSTLLTVSLGSLSYSNMRDWEKSIELRKSFLMELRYKNYKGEVGDYLIYPLDVRFGSNDYHKTPQWLLIADKYNPNDLNETPKRRTFAIRDIISNDGGLNDNSRI